MAAVNKTLHRPGAIDHGHLVAAMVTGHQAIANAVAEYAAAKAQRLADARALYGAEKAAEGTGRPNG